MNDVTQQAETEVQNEVQAHDNTDNGGGIKSLYKDVAALGKQSALGQDALPRLALRVAKASSEGVITTDKDADGKDDYHRIYNHYIENEAKPAAFHSPNGKKANVSKLRKVGEAASLPSVDFYDACVRAVSIHKEMRDAQQKPKPLYAGIVDMARYQIDNADSALTDDDVRNQLGKADPKEKTLEGELTKVAERLEKLITGEVEGIPADTDEKSVQAFELLRERLAAMMQESKLKELRAKVAEMGLTAAELAEMAAA
jgi:hypothetical protein